LVEQVDLQINLSKSKIQSNGIFKRSTFKVTVSTYPMNWVVTRTYEDFKWLHSSLEARFPANFLVELPQIELVEAKKESDEQYLNTFLNALICSSDFLYSPELEEFLQLSDKEFAKAKEVATKLKQENHQTLL
jgi:hypothetical protein